MSNQDDTVKIFPDLNDEGMENNQDLLADAARSGSSEATPSSPQKKNKKRWGRKVFLAVLIFILIVAVSGALGYAYAIRARVRQEQAQISTAVYDQFLLGIVNMERGEYEIARQRFEYILKLDPDHSGAASLLTEAILHLGESSTVPTPRPSATPAPTVDTRGQADIYTSALAFRDIEDWNSVINTLDSLRTIDPNYKPVEVDGLYYIAYRNRGIHRIQKESNLEAGIFDLTRAEAFGPLDVEARNYRKWAEDYLTGVSFWGVDWAQALTYFNQLVISAPYLSDSSYLTSLDRQATAQYELYSQYLVSAGYRMNQGKYCEAYDLYNEASLYIVFDQNTQLSFEFARDKCLGVAPPPAPTDTPTP
jgi:tetratricopeptide (TPR) repeat protein